MQYKIKYRGKIIRRNNVCTLGKSLGILPGEKETESVLQAKKETLAKARRSLVFGNY